MISSRSLPDRQALQQMAKRYPELDIPSIETCLAFLDTITAFYAAVDSYFAQFGLSRGKVTLLMQLVEADEDGLLPSEFAERAGVTRATVTSLLDGLEREQLVTRQPHPDDRRMLRVHMTEKGRELMNEILPDHFCRMKDFMAHLSDRDKKTFIRLLNKLRAGIPALYQ